MVTHKRCVRYPHKTKSHGDLRDGFFATGHFVRSPEPPAVGLFYRRAVVGPQKVVKLFVPDMQIVVELPQFLNKEIGHLG